MTSLEVQKLTINVINSVTFCGEEISIVIRYSNLSSYHVVGKEL